MRKGQPTAPPKPLSMRLSTSILQDNTSSCSHPRLCLKRPAHCSCRAQQQGCPWPAKVPQTLLAWFGAASWRAAPASAADSVSARMLEVMVNLCSGILRAIYQVHGPALLASSVTDHKPSVTDHEPSVTDHEPSKGHCSRIYGQVAYSIGLFYKKNGKELLSDCGRGCSVTSVELLKT
eukprot:1160214-Pelagomonas_calceolata.AAC.3